MSEVPGSSGWWLASDGKWYPPEQSPGPTRQEIPPPPSFTPGGYGPPPTVPPTPPGYGPPPTVLAYGYGPPPATHGYGYGFSADYQPLAALTPKTNGVAVASLVCSFFFWLFGLGAVLAIVFGFVARSQIKRARGAQRGQGLALAGIIIGFVSLALILPAIAIPTFIGVKADSVSVVHLSPTPIAVGYPEQGGHADPITWDSRSQTYDTTLTAVSGGVEMTIGSPAQAEWAAVPVEKSFQSMQLSANVAIIAGTASNRIGLGCITPTLGDQVEFLVANSGSWQIAVVTSEATVIADSGVSSAIPNVGGNVVTIACRDDVDKPGFTQASFEVNGTPVANDILGVASSAWIPTVELCSCYGTVTGSFLHAAYFASIDEPN